MDDNVIRAFNDNIDILKKQRNIAGGKVLVGFLLTAIGGPLITGGLVDFGFAQGKVVSLEALKTIMVPK